MRYIYRGDRITKPELKNMECDPVLNSKGKCIICFRMASALVVDSHGNQYVVNRRQLRLKKG